MNAGRLVTVSSGAFSITKMELYDKPRVRVTQGVANATPCTWFRIRVSPYQSYHVTEESTALRLISIWVSKLTLMDKRRATEVLFRGYALF